MVVCKCRKATRLYCFVHKVPVCGECVCFPEHQICVVKKYSDWVVDGEYDWPPTCSLCNAALEAESNSQTTRLGCLHLMHTECLVSHMRNFPPQTAPAGYVCPACSSPIWPPKSIKDTGSRLHSKLKETIILSGLEKNIFGSHLVPLPDVENRPPPPPFASDPLVSVVDDRAKNSSNPYSSVSNTSLLSSFPRDEKFPSDVYISTAGTSALKIPEQDIIEIDNSVSAGNQLMSDHDPSIMKSSSPVGPGATTRKGSYPVDRQNSEISYYADDEDGSHKKYSRRGPFRHKFLRMLLPFWSSALPTLPVTAPPRKEVSNKVDGEVKTRHQKSSRMDPRKILLIMAIIACMTTMGILYYRLAQSSLGESHPEGEEEPQ